MKIKRRWKVLSVLPMIWCVVGLAVGIPLLENSYEAWIEVYGNSLLLFGGWLIGTATGVVIYHGAIDAEEREKADWKFQDNVYTMYEDCIMNKWTEERAINDTAIHYDTTPSNVRRIVKVYEK